MGKIYKNGIQYSGTTDAATNINYDNSKGAIRAGNVQGAIDEIMETTSQSRTLTQAEYDALPDTKYTDGIEYFITDAEPLDASTIAYDNTASKMTATNVQAGIDELNSNINNSIGDISNVGNSTYNSVEKLLKYYIDNGYLPDINSLPLIPTMTSNTAPSGVASASGVVSTVYDAYKAFDDNASTWWNGNGGAGQWLQYKFTKKVCVKKLTATNEQNTNKMGVFKLQGSNDGSSFTDIATINAKDTKSITQNIANTNYYQYYRVYCVSDTSDFSLNSLQLYGITQ